MSFKDTKSFYKSREWESFRQVVIADRTDPDGYVHCAICGKPILKKYDLILHHKQELTDMNVLDVSVSLNPDNVECVHFQCHNKIHERFGFNKTSVHTYTPKRVYIVYGAPLAGKTTWVNSVATPDDLIVDMDNIWEMISINSRYTKPNALKSVVFDVRDKLYDVIKYRSGNWINAFVIVGGAMKGDRNRLKQRVAADEFIFIDTTQQECLNRLKERDIDNNQKADQIRWIEEWFERYQAD